jgi:hypothetical protein
MPSACSLNESILCNAFRPSTESQDRFNDILYTLYANTYEALQCLHPLQEQFHIDRREFGWHGSLLIGCRNNWLQAQPGQGRVPVGTQGFLVISGLDWTKFNFVAAHVHNDSHDTPPCVDHFVAATSVGLGIAPLLNQSHIACQYQVDLI